MKQFIHNSSHGNLLPEIIRNMKEEDTLDYILNGFPELIQKIVTQMWREAQDQWRCAETGKTENYMAELIWSENLDIIKTNIRKKVVMFQKK